MLHVVYDSREHSHIALINVRLSHLACTDKVSDKHVKGGGFVQCFIPLQSWI